MAFNRESAFDTAQIAGFLQEAVKKIKTEEDPIELNELKKVFKKNVPFTLRTYTAAYLVKLLCGGHKTNRYERQDKFKRFSDENRVPHSVIDESVAETIFVSIGRNRRVFPRDLITLLITGANIERERIGEIRILDNYSFVQVYAEDAEKIILALNGSDYRGRKLAVSYSRKREDSENQEASTNKEPENNNENTNGFLV